jgi:hypothetical protein
MKSSSNKLNKVKDLPKGDNTANKEFANMEQGTPEIFARSKLSLDENSSRTEEEKDMQLRDNNTRKHHKHIRRSAKNCRTAYH